MSRKAICAEQLAKDHVAGRVRRPHVAETGRSTPPAAWKPHAWFCSWWSVQLVTLPPTAEQLCDAEYARS